MSAVPIPGVIVRCVAAATRPVRARVPRAERLSQAEDACHRWLVAHSIAILRISLGAVFLGFGALKFFPGVSPAQGLVEATTNILTLGLVPGPDALAGVAAIFILARRGTVEPAMGFNPVLKAFIASVIGGLGSLSGAVMGGFVLAFIISG